MIWVVLAVVVATISVLIAVCLLLRWKGVFAQPATAGDIVVGNNVSVHTSYGSPTANTIVSMIYTTDSNVSTVNYDALGTFKPPQGNIVVTGLNLFSNVYTYASVSNNEYVLNYSGPFNYSNLHVQGQFQSIFIGSR